MSIPRFSGDGFDPLQSTLTTSLSGTSIPASVPTPEPPVSLQPASLVPRQGAAQASEPLPVKKSRSVPKHTAPAQLHESTPSAQQNPGSHAWTVVHGEVPEPLKVVRKKVVQGKAARKKIRLASFVVLMLLAGGAVSFIGEKLAEAPDWMSDYRDSDSSSGADLTYPDREGSAYILGNLAVTFGPKEYGASAAAEAYGVVAPNSEQMIVTMPVQLQNRGNEPINAERITARGEFDDECVFRGIHFAGDASELSAGAASDASIFMECRALSYDYVVVEVNGVEYSTSETMDVP